MRTNEPESARPLKIRIPVDPKIIGFGIAAEAQSKLPRLALRIGTVGHRPPKLPHSAEEAIRASVHHILRKIETTLARFATIFDAYAKTPPVLHVITAGAEGADSLVADVGLSCGFQIQCVLPAFREIYRKDFESPRSEQFLDGLVSAAASVFELDGRREDEWLEVQAYETAGRIILAHSDLLLAVWDGKPGDRGGTEQMVREALNAGIPVISISPDKPTTVILYVRGLKVETGWEQALHDALESALRPPPQSRVGVLDYLRRIPEANAADSVDVQMRHADSVAIACAGRYRQVYWLIYTLAPIAVVCAVCGLIREELPVFLPEWIFSLSELAVIFAMILATLLGRKKHLHERWLDARILAEQFRIWRFLATMGQILPSSRLPPYMSQRTVERHWTAWYVRSWSRGQRIVTEKVTTTFIESRWQAMKELVDEQITHHKSKGRTRRRTHEALELATNIVFVSVAIACVSHFVLGSLTRPPIHMLVGLTVITAMLPAFLSALEGLQAQGEYLRLSDRAEGMQHQFELISLRLQERDIEDVSYSEMVHIAHDISAIMLDELSDWRNLIRVRVLHPA